MPLVQDLINKRSKYFGGIDCYYITKEEFLINFDKNKEEAKQMIAQYFQLPKDRNDPIFMMGSILAGNTSEINRLIAKRWKLFVLVYILYVSPCSDLYDLNKALFKHL